MKTEKIKKIGMIFAICIWFIFVIFCFVLPNKEFSESERRKLTQFPEISAESIFNGSFVQDFEKYTLDQFPFRDQVRVIKSIFHYGPLLQGDNNKIYIYDGNAIKMDAPLNKESVDYATNLFNKVYNKYLKGKKVNVYMSVIPDKNYFYADDSKHLSMDYNYMIDSIKNISWAEYIDITDYVVGKMYYRTDTHWAQQFLTYPAEKICSSMGSEPMLSEECNLNKANLDFYGVYYGQAAVPMKPDELWYLENEIINEATVFDYETNQTYGIYNLDLENSKDKYDLFLHGAKALLRIDNPNATSNKELVIFRDSFGSSITPLLIKSYKSVYIVDLRYIQSDALKNYIRFNNQDVLFLYSTLVLNESFTMK